MYLKGTKPIHKYLCRVWNDTPGDYIIYRTVDGHFYYYDPQTSRKNLVKPESSIWNHDNFESCNRDGTLKTKQKENKMANVNYIGGEYKIVKVKYLGSESYYNFKADIDMKIKDDDLVVVEASNGYGLARVSAIIENNVNNADAVAKAKAWIVSVIDTSRQDQRKEATRQRAYIIQQLDEKKSQMESISVYELLAKHDPSAKKLLQELKTIGS